MSTTGADTNSPGANYYNGCQTLNVWWRNVSRSRASRPRGSWTQQTKPHIPLKVRLPVALKEEAK